MTAITLVTPLLAVVVVVLASLSHITMTTATLASDPSAAGAAIASVANAATAAAAASTNGESGGPLVVPPEAKAEALISKPPANQQNVDSTNTNQNVILIKYANVTTKQQIQGDDTQQQQQQLVTTGNKLNVYHLYNEPLSVSVIESKFSHSIQLFDVSHNQLSTLSKDLFCPLSNEVRQLNISHNLLDNFDCLGLISQDGQLCLKELRVLDMSYNLIKHLPATGVATLQNLEVLNLSHNLIESLDELSLSSLSKLIRLDLSFNRLQQLPMRVFHKSSSMQVLMLQSNQLQNNINQSFLSGLISLEELNLSFNNISHVSESAFLAKPNLTRVDLSHNQLNGLRQEALKVTVLVSSVNHAPRYQQQQPQPTFKPRMYHNGQYAQTQQSSRQQQQAIASQQPMTNVEFYLSSNPFVCDCHLEWMRTFQPAIKRSVLSTPGNRFQHNYHQADSLDGSPTAMSLYQNDQPVSVIQQQQQSSSSATAADPTATSNNISENVQTNQQQSSSISSTLSSTATNQQAASDQYHYGRIADLDLIKCSPLFRRNSQLKQQQQQHRHSNSLASRASGAPSDGSHHNLAVQVHHANNHLHHYHQSHNQQQHHMKPIDNSLATASQPNMIDLLTADSSNFLCRYKSHCFALCHCCEFDACDCEMICPVGCNCYYNLKWQTNIIDCSSNNHTVVPERIPMDVSGLYLDGNNIDSLKPSNLIARKSLKTLYLNSTNLQYIANRTFNGLIELQTLYLNDNMLRSLQGYEFEPLAQLKALYLQSNRLDRINNQTFIYLRSLEVLDLSNNRLTSLNLDLFMFIGHHNIRLRQLSIAHNWWSCQCNSITSFREILKQKFLLNGGVNIVDKNQLRCYYNSTTVGPLILDGIASSGSSVISSQQPVFGFPAAIGQTQNRKQQQQQLTEINQCSDMIEERPYDADINPPIIYTPPPPSPPPQMLQDFPPIPAPNDSPDPSNPYPQPEIPPGFYPPSNMDPNVPQIPAIISPGDSPRNPLPPAGMATSVPLASFVIGSVLFACVFVVAISVFIFLRQQQQRYHNHHHKKSSAASTTSVSSSASSTAISTGATLHHGHHHHGHHHNHGTSKFSHHDHHLNLPQPSHFDNGLQQQHNHHLIFGANGQQQQQQRPLTNSNQVLPQAQHHHSASSQSNIYAALVPPTTNGGSSTIVTNNKQQQNSVFNSNNLYSNSIAASHHSPSNSSQQNGQNYLANRNNGQGNWHQQPLYGSQAHQHQLYGQVNLDNPYAINSSVASYKTATSLHNASLPPLAHGGGDQYQERPGIIGSGAGDWISLPKVKQFMSKLVNKSLAFSGYRSSLSRDELSNITSDKIYDAFLSYDKRDEQFVMQYLSAELEYGSPQYRVADRYRDLPLPSSAYIAEAITSVIGCSHRTIIVLTENYLSSDWCRYELQAALRETAIDKSHKVIVVVLEPKCLQEMDSEMRNLLLSATGGNLVTPSPAASAASGGGQLYSPTNNSQQLVQLADNGSGSSPSAGDYLAQHQLVTTLTNQSGGNQQVCTQTTAAAGTRVTFINYNERKFWTKIKQLMPVARPSTQTLTLTTKN
uniref:Slit 3 protein n=1 Tax=Aceria tosichella TaxID=561515 RepID=A0A6G1SI29_9ACAR